MSMPLGFGTRLLKARSLNRGILNSLRLTAFYTGQLLAHSTPLKLANLVAAKAQKYLKRDRVWGMPYRYTIDPLNVCNLRCPLCPTGLGTLGRERGKMKLEDFTRIIDQIAPYAYSVELYNWGEPFLHPQIFDMIQYASSKKIAVKLSSNLNRYSQDMAVKTIQAGLDWIIVSVDGATQESYEKYRRGGKLERVFDNIRTLVEEKQKVKSKIPFITLRMLINRYNEHEIDQMRELAHELGVDAFTTGTLFVDTTDQKQIDEWLPIKEEYSYYNYSAEKLENVWHCSDLWESLTINWDGGSAPCCWLHEKGHDIGNVFEQPLKDLWNGDAYISSRRVFAFGGPKEGPMKTICTTCKGRPLYLKD
jgi:MoaA/NifB/PqqE/SkfB family radical SAM enzyme